MSFGDLNQHLSQMQTMWTLVRQAHQDAPGPAVNAAQELILKRYGGAVRRYLVAALRDQDAADEVFQEFSYRLVHGDLKGADPERGRFRQFVKGVLFHLVADHHRRRQRLPHGMSPDHPEPAVEDPSTLDQDREFLTSWREEILSRSWAALEAEEKASGKPFYSVLRFRVDHAKMSSTEMAEGLGKQMGKNMSSVNVRQTLHRARERFADVVLDEVLHSLDKPSVEQLEQELIDLGLLEYCRPALERRS